MKEYVKGACKKYEYGIPESIYTLVNPELNEIFYIGRTKKPLSDRLWGHIAAAKKKGEKFTNTIKDSLIRDLLSKNLRPKIVKVETILPLCLIEYLEIAEREIYWMKYFKDKGCGIMNIMGLHIIQPNAEYLWYTQCLKKGEVPLKYYYIGEDNDGNKLYHKQRMLQDGQQWSDDIIKQEYNPFKNALFLKKMGIAV